MSSSKVDNGDSIDNDANEDGDSKSPIDDGQINKQTAADLEKVSLQSSSKLIFHLKMTDFHEEGDEMNEVSKESLGNLKAQPEQKKFTLKKEDIQTIVSREGCSAC
jgi:hypothetical protein